MTDLRLNIFPANLVASSVEELIRAPAEAKFVADWRKLPGFRTDFQVYILEGAAWIWALPGRQLPNEPEPTDFGRIKVADVPSRVWAFAAREAVVGKLQADHGFERLWREVEGSVRLFRWERNLLKDLPGLPVRKAGVLPRVSVQGWVFGEPNGIGPDVGVVMDLQLSRVMDESLSELVDLGVDLTGVELLWRHALECACSPRLIGRAGELHGGDVRGTVTVIKGKRRRSAPAACLKPKPTDTLIAAYLERRTAVTSTDVLTLMREKAMEFQATTAHWSSLDATRKLLSPVTLFNSVRADLGPAVEVSPSDEELAGRPTLAAAASNARLNFRLGEQLLNANAAIGLSKHGPYDLGVSGRRDNLRFTVLAPKAMKAEAARLASILRAGVSGWPGFSKTYRLKGLSIDVELLEQDDADGYRSGARQIASKKPDLVFLVIRVEDRWAAAGENPYLAAKAPLLSAGVQVQAVTLDKLRLPDSGIRWVVEAMSLASYAKLGNVPFVLFDPAGVAELILGVGRSDVFDDDDEGDHRQVFGTSVAFRQDGDFLYSGATVSIADSDTYQKHLSEVVRDQARRYPEVTGTPLERVIVHVFKRAGHQEYDAVRAALEPLGIEFAIVHVNRDSPIWLMRLEDDGNAIRPPRGSVIRLDDHDYLLALGDPNKQMPAHPLRLTLHSASTYRDMPRLVNQAFGLSLTSYRGFLPGIEPSPTLYGRLLAEKVSQLQLYGLSLNQADMSLSSTPWFI